MKVIGMNSLLFQLILIACIRPGMAVPTENLMHGDVVLGGLFVIQNSANSPSCGNNINSESVQRYQAVRWFFQRLNERNFIPNITLGFHAYKTCGIPSLAVKETFKMLTTYEEKDVLYGILGPQHSSETQDVSRLLSSLPLDDRLLEISYSATAQVLSDRNVYQNLYRVIEADDTQVQVMLHVLLVLGWNYVAIVYEMDTYGEASATALKKLATENNICLPVFEGIHPKNSTEDQRRKFKEINSKLEKSSKSPVLGMIFIGHATTARVMLEFLNINLKEFQIIFSESLGLHIRNVQAKVTNEVYDRAKGSLIVSPPYTDVVMFQTYWRDLHNNASLTMQEIQQNTWLFEYFKAVSGCTDDKLNNISNLSGCIAAISPSQRNSSVSLYIHYALIAAATFAKAVKKVFEEAETTGVMNIRRKVFTKVADLKVNVSADFPEELYPYNRTFSFGDGKLTLTNETDSSSSIYTVYNLQRCEGEKIFCFKQVGSFVEQKLLLKKIKSYKGRQGEDGLVFAQVEAGPVSAQCQPTYNCLMCHTSHRPNQVLYIPGDFYIVGLVPVHNRGVAALECGELRTALSVDIAEAIAFAVQEINEKKGLFGSLLDNKTVGLVILDTCGTALLTQERVIQLLRGNILLNPVTNSSQIAEKIIGYIGPYRSSVSVPLSTILNQVNSMYISYSSTSTSLSDRHLYPYFMRTCSPDSKQAEAIMCLASKLGSKYVQIIYTDEEYGRAGMKALVKASKRHHVCIAQTLSVKDSTDAANLKGYVSDLRRYRHAKVVIIFAISHVTPLLIKALDDEIDVNEFSFIGGENWGQRAAVLGDNQKLGGSLTLAQLLPKNPDYEKHYTQVNVGESRNPWLQDYLEQKAKCHFTRSFNKKHARDCTPDIIAQHQQTDTWVPFTINAVFALVMGFDIALRSKCNQIEWCQECTTTEVIRYVGEVQLDIYNDGTPVRVFDDNGEGSVGYTISQVVREGKTFVYRQVGVSTPTDIQLSLPLSDLLNDDRFNTKCPNEVDCSKCWEETSASDSRFPVIIMCLASAAGVLLVAVITVSICLIRQRGLKERVDDPYLTVMPDPFLDSCQQHNEGHDVRVCPDEETDYAQAFPEEPNPMLKSDS